MYIVSAYTSSARFSFEPRSYDNQRGANFPVSFAKSYIDEMLQAGISIKTLAEQTGICPSTLYRLTAGKTQKPTNKTFRLLLSTYCRLILLK